MTTTCSNTLLIIIVSTYIRVDCERNRETTTTKLIIVAITILIIIVVAAAAATTITKHIIVAIAILIIAAAAAATTTNKNRTLKMIICITLCYPAYLKYVFYTATKVKSEYMYIRQKKCENSERVSH